MGPRRVVCGLTLISKGVNHFRSASVELEKYFLADFLD
jgi:hypothetical protein